MKKGKIILSAIAVLAAVGSAFAFNMHKLPAQRNIFTTPTCSSLSPCTKLNTAIPCELPDIPVYTVTNNVCRVYTGPKFTAQ